MAEEKGPEFLIIKRSRSESETGHHGAWKIAFADFMTAMMALFLVLWLLSATSEKTKSSVARYFNPVNLVDMTTMKRGIHDPAKLTSQDGLEDSPPPAGPNGVHGDKGKQTPRTGGPKPQSKEGGAKPPSEAGSAGNQPTHSESALFRDPYAVLAEIAAEGAATRDIHVPSVKQPNVGVAPNFQDPFAAATPVVPKPEAPQSPPPDSHEQSAVAAGPPRSAPAKSVPAQQSAAKVLDNKASSEASSAAAHAIAEKPVEPSPPKNELAADKAANPAAVQKANEIEAQRLQKEIAKTVGKGEAAPDIQVKPTGQGVLISLTDGFDFAMFAIGSSEPQRRTLQIMEKIAHILNKEPGTIIISGHTDGRHYRTRTYDNWRLSTARAQMALYMLVRGGFDEKRIERIEGAADHDLKVPKNPMAADNRRIEILLRKTNS